MTSPEAVKVLLSYVYNACTGAQWQYEADSLQVNRDVLRLGRAFNLPNLHEHAARWIARGLTTANVVERLVTCDELGLGLLKEKIVERLTLNPSELMMVSSSPEMMHHPRILQELLVQVASLRERPNKKGSPMVQSKQQQEKPAKRARRIAGGA